MCVFWSKCVCVTSFSNLDLLIAEEGKYLEGDKRINFLQDKLMEIKRIYMTLKAEVACIDRRRKRHKRKEREGRGSHSNSAHRVSSPVNSS